MLRVLFVIVRKQGYCPDGTACRLKHELPDRKTKREACITGDEGVSNLSCLLTNTFFLPACCGILLVLCMISNDRCGLALIDPVDT